MLPICRNIEYYNPGSIKTEKNSKQNKIFRLSSLCNENNFPIKSAHTSADDTEGLLNLVKHCATKAPDLFKKSLEMKLKINVKPKIQSEDYFCFSEFFFGKSRNVVGSYFSEGIFPNYHFVIDLKTDVEAFFSIKSDHVLLVTDASEGLSRYYEHVMREINQLDAPEKRSTLDDIRDEDVYDELLLELESENDTVH